MRPRPTPPRASDARGASPPSPSTRLRPAATALAALAALALLAHAAHADSRAPSPARAAAARPERAGATPEATQAAPTVPVHVAAVAAEHPHDRSAFTQGLEFAPHCGAAGGGDCTDAVWESTGVRERVCV